MATFLLAAPLGLPVGLPAVEASDDGLFARVEIAPLKNGLLPIPANMSVAIEIGTSDRDTLDRELLPYDNNLFLVSAEPLIDKYARGLARFPKGDGDTFQPLGHHNPRGLILPLAISDGGPAAGEIKTFNVGANAGCSSMLPVDKTSNRLKWCRHTKEKREVPSVTLGTLLQWIGNERPIEFIKIDAQGMDLRVIESAGSAISRVRRFQLEVISDDCHGLYVGQPRCSEVLLHAEKLGFSPAAEVFCKPRVPRSPKWRRTAWGCELEVVFLARGVAITEPLKRFHKVAMNGCIGMAPNDAPPSELNGTLVMEGAGKWSRDGHRVPDDGFRERYLCRKRLITS
uniref:Methyltransferase FkbM domain-containing protein n=1 Tax=Calcidiscus leptoporus TaxID=127549 RepID=A0A7S0JIX5_9EUKA|mmetsp:Transcript_60171/g.138019  ORF Transcript_60171/g.138019 Transcript_60171/m.138019 type:complete len:342 (+) Transcript_60171:82-1107(+)